MKHWFFVVFGALLLGRDAHAVIDPECMGMPKPADYDEQVQQDFLSNYFALVTSMSAIHGPIPHESGHGGLGLDLLGMPPLSCEKRYALNWSKTNDTNKTPVVPRPRVTFSLPMIGKVTPYAGLAWVPPITIFGTRNVIMGIEFGAGGTVGDNLQLGGRVHAGMQKTVADIATAFNPDIEPSKDDLYLASTFGVDLMAGWALEGVTPYVSAGFTDVSTIFYVGDDGVIANNLHPYAGPTFALGADGRVKEKFIVAGELYWAPGGYSMPDPEAFSVEKGTRYGHLLTARLRVGLEL
jgi:hypothetical protein